MDGARRIVAGLEAARVTLGRLGARHVDRPADGRRARIASIRAVDAAARRRWRRRLRREPGRRAGRGADPERGLFNCGGVLAGLVELYRVPCFFIVSYRGDARDPVYYHAPGA